MQGEYLFSNVKALGRAKLMKHNIIVCMVIFGLLYHAQSGGMERSLAEVQCGNLHDVGVDNLCWAIHDDNRSKVKLLVKDKLLVNRLCQMFKYTVPKGPLHFASHYARHACMEILLKNGADPNLVLIESGTVPLHYVCSERGASLLLKYGSCIDKKNNCGKTPFAQMIQDGSFEAAQALLSAGANINSGDKKKNSPLHNAVYERRLDSVEFLLHNNADPNKRNALGETPFDAAIKTGWRGKDILNLFEEHGLLFFSGLHLKELLVNPLTVARGSDDVDYIMCIHNWARLFTAARVAKKYQNRNSPVGSGIVVNAYGCIVNRISDKDLESIFDRMTLENAKTGLARLSKKILDLVSLNDSPTLKKYIQDYPFLLTYDLDQAERMMIRAINHCDTNCLKVLLSNRIDCYQSVTQGGRDMCDGGGNFLHQAVFKDKPEAIGVLVDCGIDCTYCDNSGNTPIEYAVMLGRKDCVARLNKLMGEFFVYCLWRRQYKKCKQLISQITNYNVRLKKNKTLLHYIVAYTNSKYVKKYIALLKDKGADFNLFDSEGHTPLLHMIRLEDGVCDDVVELLLNSGAQVDTYDSCGTSILGIMVSHKNYKLVELLLRYGATVMPHMLTASQWKGTALLQEAYNIQQQKIYDKLQEFEVNNKKLAFQCCICFESLSNLKKIPCKQIHSGVSMCTVCCQELYDRDAVCPICRGQLL